jgi:flagellar assembly protein FliH
MSCKLRAADETAMARPVAWRLVDPRAKDAQVPSEAAVSSSELEQVLQAHREVEGRLFEVEQSIEPLKREAWETGFRAGRLEARQAADRELEEERRRFAEAVSYMAQLRVEWRREIESDAVALAMAVARRVLNRELSIDTDAVQAIVRLGLEKASGQELRRVRVSAAQAQSVRTCLSREAPGVELVADPALQPGQLQFEMMQGAMDASVEAQLEEIQRGLADAVSR